MKEDIERIIARLDEEIDERTFKVRIGGKDAEFVAYRISHLSDEYVSAEREGKVIHLIGNGGIFSFEPMEKSYPIVFKGRKESESRPELTAVDEILAPQAANFNERRWGRLRDYERIERENDLDLEVE